MDTEAIYKALANPIRRQILQCLKEPERYISTEECGNDFSRGVCAGQMEKIADISQSTMSNHFICSATGRADSCDQIWAMVLFLA